MLLSENSYSRQIKSQNGKLLAELTVCHDPEQADLAHWKADEINRLFDSHVMVREYDDDKIGFSVIRGRRIRVIHKWFHRCGKKAITNKISFMDHPVGMAMLLCDMSFVKKSEKSEPCISIALPCFSKDDVGRLLAHIRKFCGADGYLSDERWECRELIFDAENSENLWDYISLWIPKVPSVLDKFSFIGEKYGLNQGDP